MMASCGSGALVAVLMGVAGYTGVSHMPASRGQTPPSESILQHMQNADTA